MSSIAMAKLRGLSAAAAAARAHCKSRGWQGPALLAWSELHGLPGQTKPEHGMAKLHSELGVQCTFNRHEAAAV